MARKTKEAVLVAEPEMIENEEMIQEMQDAAVQEMTETLEAPIRLPKDVKHAEMISAANELAQIMNDGETDQDILKAKKKNLKNAVSAYNLELSHYWYRKWAEDGNAVLKALTLRFVPDAVKVNVVKDEDSGWYYAEETSDGVKMKVSLPDIQNVLGRGVFAESDWAQKCNKLAFLYAGKIARNLRAEKALKYRIPDSAREFEFSEEYGSVYSNAFFIHALQCVYDSILMIPDDETGENTIKVRPDYDDDGVVFSPEWEYVTDCFKKQGSEVGIVLLGNLAKMAELIADTMYLSITGGEYGTEVQKKGR